MAESSVCARPHPLAHPARNRLEHLRAAEALGVELVGQLLRLSATVMTWRARSRSACTG